MTLPARDTRLLQFTFVVPSLVNRDGLNSRTTELALSETVRFSVVCTENAMRLFLHDIDTRIILKIQIYEVFLKSDEYCFVNIIVFIVKNLLILVPLKYFLQLIRYYR